MIYILLFILLLMIAISFYVSKFDILSPWFISIAMYIISLLFVLLNRENLDIGFSAFTVIVIIMALWAFGIGEIFARILFKDKDHKMVSAPSKKIKFHWLLNILIYISSLVILILYYYKILNIAIQVGYQSGQNLLIQYARLGILQHGISIGPILAISTFALRSISYIYTFVFLYNKLLSRKEKWFKDLHLLIPSVIYLVQYSLSGSRGGLIEYISYFIVLIALFMVKLKKRKKENNKRIIKYAIIGITIFFIIFSALGNLKGWKGTDPISLISVYTGGSILALDTYLLSDRVPNNVFGQETLLGIHSLLNRIGLNKSSSFDKRIDYSSDFVAIGPELSTNIYTSLKRYIQDFGFLGMLFIQLLFGLVMNILYLKIRNLKRINYVYILYAILFMMIVYQSIDDQFLRSFLSVTQIFTITFTYIFYWFLLRKQIIVSDFNKDIKSHP